LDHTGLPPDRLVLEITESVLVENHHIASRALHALKELGVRVHLDDFGTGFSSLSYLQQLPIDCIKIDRSFVSGIATKGKDLEIVRAIIGLGHGLGKSVVAEGIETDGQLQRLRGLDCDFGQGFLFSPPVDSWASLPLCA
jgi:EAL domain-containing protein (putative c-di-GMP-specific phosphodiesterase class I)